MYPEVFFWRRRMIPIIPTYAGVPGFPPPMGTETCEHSTFTVRMRNIYFLFDSSLHDDAHQHFFHIRRGLALLAKKKNWTDLGRLAMSANVCLSATPLKRQTFLSVADISEMSS